MAKISLQSVHKTYSNQVHVIHDVSMEIRQGEFCVFVGPSGCGKSTLLRMVAGLEDITSGVLEIDGVRMNDTPPSDRRVAMVFQSYALFPHMTVFENMSFGMRLAKRPAKEIQEKVANAARILQLEHLLDRLPKALSGGQRQRVAIGRAIVRDPGVFLFDEPLSNLDAALRVQTRFEIAKLHRDYGQASTIYVTHDQTEAMTLADRIMLLNSGKSVMTEGSVAQCGSPLTLYHFPRNQFVAGFIGSPKMNFLAGTLLSRDEQRCSIKLREGGEHIEARVDARALSEGAPVTLGVRPEHIELSSEASAGIVRELLWQERLGESSYLYVRGESGTEPTVLRATGQAFAAPGQRLALRLPAEHCHVFDAQGMAMPRSVDVRDVPIALPN